MEFTRPGSPLLVVAADTSKVLDFLATHQEDFELDYEATFTENFRKQTSMIKKAELRTLPESEHSTEVEIRIEAVILPLTNLSTPWPQAKPPQARQSICFRDLKEKASRIQRRVSANPDAPLLARSSHPIENFRLQALRISSSRQTPASKRPQSGRSEVQH